MTSYLNIWTPNVEFNSALWTSCTILEHCSVLASYITKELNGYSWLGYVLGAWGGTSECLL